MARKQITSGAASKLKLIWYHCSLGLETRYCSRPRHTLQAARATDRVRTLLPLFPFQIICVFFFFLIAIRWTIILSPTQFILSAPNPLRFVLALCALLFLCRAPLLRLNNASEPVHRVKARLAEIKGESWHRPLPLLIKLFAFLPFVYFHVSAKHLYKWQCSWMGPSGEVCVPAVSISSLDDLQFPFNNISAIYTVVTQM